MEKLNKKLQLNKEIIAKLNDESLDKVQGGGGVTHTCNTITGCPVLRTLITDCVATVDDRNCYVMSWDCPNDDQ
jgi:hypothetical protein